MKALPHQAWPATEPVAGGGQVVPGNIGGPDFALLSRNGVQYAKGQFYFCRPVVLFRLGPETCRGSGRSIPEFDLMAALEDCQDLLTNFGGHTKAAGFTLPRNNLAQLQQRLFNLAQDQLAGLDLRPHMDIDAEVPLSTLAQGTFNKIQQLAPFGQGNPLPTFVSRQVEVIDRQQVGSESEHLRLKLKQQAVVWDAIGFRLGNLVQEITPRLDIAYNLDLDRWKGVERLQLKLLDFAPAD